MMEVGETKQAWNDSVAADDRYVYVGGPSGEVLVYPIDANGRRAPYATLSGVAFTPTVALGP